MVDRMKVIKGLELCTENGSFAECISKDCPFIGGSIDGNCIEMLMHNALALLKALDVTPEELERLKMCRAECKIDCLLEHYNNVKDELDAMKKVQEPITGETSDGYHTFNELYHHRAVLFSVIVANYPDRAWKSKKHHDGTMYDNMFIVGIDTPDGQATYHYDVDPYWDMFKCRVLDNAPEWDGHTPAQAIERIGKLKAQEPRVMKVGDVRKWVNSDRVTREPVVIEIRGGVCAWIIDDEVRELPGEANLSSDLYGKTWRVWTSAPSDEVRRTTPWE